MACYNCRTSCADRCNSLFPCFSMYPSVCAVFSALFISAILAAIFGGYCFISVRQSLFMFLQWSSAWYFIINVSFLAVVAAGLLALLSVLIWCVCPSYRAGVIYKVIFAILLIFVLLLFATCMVCSILMLYGASRRGTIFARELERVWLLEISSNSTVPCRIQKQLRCHGMETGDCQRGPTQNASRCGETCRPEDLEGKPPFDTTRLQGCRESISHYFILWHALLLGGTSVPFIMMLIAVFVVCRSVSFEKEN